MNAPKAKLKIFTLGENKLGIQIMDFEDITVMNRVRNIPNRAYIARFQHWECAADDANIDFIENNFQPEELDLTDEAQLLLKYINLRSRQAENKQSRRWEYVFSGQVPKINYEPYTKGFEHQVVCLDAVHGSEFFGIFMEPGCGKTWVAINEIRWAAEEFFQKNKGPYTVFVTCPGGVTHTWAKEFKKHLPPEYEFFSVNLGLLPGAVDQLVAYHRSKAPVKVLICGLDRVPVLLEFLEKFKFNLMVIDESARIKNPSSKRSKAVIHISKNADRRLAMTGTPVVNNIMDLYPQFDYLSPGVLGFPSFYAFEKAHAPMEQDLNGKKIRTYKNVDQLKAKMAKYSFVVKKVDCLDLPEKSYNTRYIEMSEKQRKMYNQMLEWLIASLTDDASNTGATSQAAAAIAQMTRLRQICGGFIKNMDGHEKDIPCATGKMDQLIDDLEEIEGKVIVWRAFRYDEIWIRRALDKMGMKFGEHYLDYTGSTPHDKRNEHEDRFNNDPNVRVLIADAGCAGEGKTLLGTETHRCATSIFWSNDFSLGKRLQAEDRNHRIGQDRDVLYLDYVCEDSIEERIAEALQNKKDMAALLSDVKSIKGLLLGGAFV
jgi:SNF2 family DNA or RNA helicase